MSQPCGCYEADCEGKRDVKGLKHKFRLKKERDHHQKSIFNYD